MFKALLIALVVMPDQAIPVAMMPYASMEECRKELVVAQQKVRENVPPNVPFVALCAPIQITPEKPGLKI